MSVKLTHASVAPRYSIGSAYDGRMCCCTGFRLAGSGYEIRSVFDEYGVCHIYHDHVSVIAGPLRLRRLVVTVMIIVQWGT